MSQDFLLCGQLQDEICHDVVTTWPFVLTLTLPVGYRYNILLSVSTTYSLVSYGVSPLFRAEISPASEYFTRVSLELNASVVLYIVNSLCPQGHQATIQKLLKIGCLLSKLACCTFFITHRWPESVHSLSSQCCSAKYNCITPHLTSAPLVGVFIFSSALQLFQQTQHELEW